MRSGTDVSGERFAVCFGYEYGKVVQLDEPSQFEALLSRLGGCGLTQGTTDALTQSIVLPLSVRRY